MDKRNLCELPLDVAWASVHPSSVMWWRVKPPRQNCFHSKNAVLQLSDGWKYATITIPVKLPLSKALNPEQMQGILFYSWLYHCLATPSYYSMKKEVKYVLTCSTHECKKF